jgi:hypothetical protein
MLANVVTGFVLIEMGTTFGVPVGIASQIRTSASTLAVCAALVMGALSVRYTYKSLLLIGVAIYGSSAVGTSLAPSFLSLLVVYALFGFGSAMVTPMVTAIIGTLLPANKRTSARAYRPDGCGDGLHLFGGDCDDQCVCHRRGMAARLSGLCVSGHRSGVRAGVEGHTHDSAAQAIPTPGCLVSRVEGREWESIRHAVAGRYRACDEFDEFLGGVFNIFLATTISCVKRLHVMV